MSEYNWKDIYECDANGKMVMEEVPPFDIKPDGSKVHNLYCTEADGDRMRAKRLLESGTPEDLAELDRMNNTHMMRGKKKVIIKSV